MPKKYLFFVLTFLIIISFTDRISADGFLKASGKRIVNSKGEEVLLKGMGLGGWLLQEGYMLKMSNFANGPTQIRSKIESLIGSANTDLFYQLYYKNHTNKKDIDRMAEWGFNSIRLPMHYKLLTPADQPGVYLEEGFKMIDSLLSWCEQNKIYLILDLHSAPGSQNTEGISDSDGEAKLWTNPQNQTRMIDLWRVLAKRYADKEWIGGYDLLNETNWDLGSNNAMLRDVLVKSTAAIRESDKNHIIFVEGNNYANNFNGLTPPWDNNMAYSFHKYWNENTPAAIGSFLKLRDDNNVPLWLGETGENSNAWFTSCIELMSQYNIGWAWWPHKKLASISGPFSAYINPGFQVLLDYWNGKTTTKPTQSFALDALYTLAMNLKMEYCEYHPDVIDAMFRQPNNSSATLPFAENTVPGRIYGVDYDLGQRGAAYNDKDYQNTGSGGYNSGDQYRNDGVDIEKCSDSETNGFNVGWIDTGDWLKYTVNVLKEGTYDITLRLAAGNSNGRISVKMDGAELAGLFSVPATGGYQTWRSFKIPKVKLPAGIHSLQLNFYYGGFNFNFIEFAENTTGVESPSAEVKDFKVFQNYPNPFNPSTMIKYSLPSESNVTITIYNSLGELVKELLNSRQSGGDKEIQFNAGNLSSGVYYYSIRSVEVQSGKEFRDMKKLVLMK